MRKKITLGAAIAFVAIGAAVTFSLTMTFALRMFNQYISTSGSNEAFMKKLTEISEIVSENYVGDVDDNTLADYIARGYLGGIGDKYAAYYDVDTYASVVDSKAGQMTGIGVRVTRDSSGYIKITEVYEGSPAESVGLQAGDLIVKIGDADVLETGYSAAVDSVKGEEGTVVSLTIRRDTEEIPYDVTRRMVEIPTVYSKAIDSVGYVKIFEFNEATATQFDTQVNDLVGQGAAALIFDLRDNPGGTLDSVTAMLDKLVPEGTLVSATYKDGKTEVLKTSDSKEIGLPMVVLVNENSASAAELFTQDLRDYNKAKIVGVNTYGKGTMQRTYQLSDGSAFQVTIAKYNSASGLNYDGVGISPDYEVELTAEQEKIVAETAFPDISPDTDSQLKKAVDVALGLIKSGNSSSGASSEGASQEVSSGAASSEAPQEGSSQAS